MVVISALAFDAIVPVSDLHLIRNYLGFGIISRDHINKVHHALDGDINPCPVE